MNLGNRDWRKRDAKKQVPKKSENDAKAKVKCKQCDYASSSKSNMKTHLKIHSGKSQTNAISVILHSQRQAI